MTWRSHMSEGASLLTGVKGSGTKHEAAVRTMERCIMDYDSVPPEMGFILEKDDAKSRF